MKVINFGIYDFFGEVIFSAVTAKSNTAYACMYEELVEYLESELEELGRHKDLEWTKDSIDDFNELLSTIRNSNTLEDLETNDLIHYEIWDVSGEFDE